MEYNEVNPEMNLVLFDNAVRHVARIARAIAAPAGHALLVGLGGSGKQSLTRLAAHMCGFTVAGIVLVAGYGLNDFREDIKRVHRRTGVKVRLCVYVYLFILCCYCYDNCHPISWCFFFFSFICFFSFMTNSHLLCEWSCVDLVHLLPTERRHGAAVDRRSSRRRAHDGACQ